MEPVNMPLLLKDLERSFIEVALNRTNGNIAAAAQLLGLKRTTLKAKVHTQSIQEPKERVEPLVDPLGEFAIQRVKTLVAVSWHGEVLKKFRTITAANQFLKEKMDE